MNMAKEEPHFKEWHTKERELLDKVLANIKRRKKVIIMVTQSERTGMSSMALDVANKLNYHLTKKKTPNRE